MPHDLGNSNFAIVISSIRLNKEPKEVKIKHLLYLVLGVALIAALAMLVFATESAVYEGESDTAELKHLEGLDHFLASGLRPQSADLAIGLSEDGLSKAISALQGIKSTIQASADTQLEIVESDIEIKPGLAQVFLGIRASSEKVPLQVTLKAKGVLLIKEIAFGKTQSDVPLVHYQIRIREISGRLGFWGFSIETRRWVNKLISSNITREFAEAVGFSLPLHFPAGFELGFTKEATHDSDNGQYTVSYSMPNSFLVSRQAIDFVPGIPADGALWFLAEFEGADAWSDIEEEKSEGPKSTKVKLDELRQRVAEKVAEFPPLEHDVAVIANASLFEAAIGAFNELPNEKRQIEMNLISRRGHITEESDEVFGQKGGYSLSFLDNDSLTGQAEFSDLESTWDNNELSLSGHVDINAKAHVKLRIDPYIGGGKSWRFWINGSAKVPIQVRIAARHLVFEDGSSAVLIGPVIPCNDFRLKLESDTRIKFGIITQEFIGEQVPEPQILMSSDVYWIRIVEQGTRGGLRFANGYWAGLRIVPESVIIGGDAFQFLANVSPSVVSGTPPNSEPTTADRRSIVDSWKMNMKTACPATVDPTYLFAGEDFGPNNDLVKIFRESERILEDLGDLAGAAGDIIQDIGTELEDIGKSIEKRFKKFFGL